MNILKLTQHASKCGSDPRRQKTFKTDEYSRSACLWLAKLEDERSRCECEPVLSPTHREYFTNISNVTAFLCHFVHMHLFIQLCLGKLKRHNTRKRNKRCERKTTLYYFKRDFLCS
jgi:hypothetical protein